MIIIDIIQNIFYLIYVLIWKKIIKKILYIITGKHQIERILKNNIQSFSTFQNLSNSLSSNNLLFFRNIYIIKHSAKISIIFIQ